MSMPTKFSHFVVLFTLWFLLAPVAWASPEELAPGRSFHYKVTSRGLRVGELKTAFTPAQYQGGAAVRFQSDLSVAANLIFFKKNSRSHEEALVTGQGTLSYKRRGEDNGVVSTVHAQLEGGRFHFKIVANGVTRSVEIPRGSYDYTTMDCPETRMKRDGETMEVRLLDMEHGVVVARHYRLLKSEDLEVGGKSIPCKVIEFSDPNNRCRRWVSSDGRGLIIARQDGSGASGSYSLRLTSMAELSR